MALLKPFRWLQTSSVWVYRLVMWSVLGLGFAFAAVVLGLRYWVLPNADHYREDIAQAISRTVAQRVTIGKISGNWDGMRPELVLENVTVHDREGRPALELPRVDGTLSWRSLLVLEPQLYQVEIHRPTLAVRRDARGTISVGGIALKDDPGAGGFTDWLLRQRQIAVRDAAISWHDELRGAPELELKKVHLQVVNRGDRHRFGLRAAPPAELAAPIDLRGDLRGDSIGTLAAWSGKLFAQLDYVDIAAWRVWIPFPIDVPNGAGALRAWITFNGERLSDIVSDVRLANVRARLAPDLPELDLAELSGRLAWKTLATGFEFSTTRLGLTAQRGVTLQPADFLLRLSAGRDKTAPRGELHANALDLEPLVLLADRLPLDTELRARLVELSPRGSLFDVVMRWSGNWLEPTQYVVRGRFQNLALNRHGRFPGFSGLSGNVDGTERAGAVYLNSAGATLSLPLVFRETLGLDTLVAQLAWSRSGTDNELRLNNVAFSNPHLAGVLSGSYRTAATGPGIVDLAGNLTRADARHAGRYVPLVVGKSTRDWLDSAILAGQSSDVSVRVKGNLSDFPFPDNKGGVFQVSAKFSGGTLDYASGWPGIENIAGELVFRGKRMDIRAREGAILGTRLAKVHAEIPDLVSTDEILRVTGDAEGPTREFLRFIDKSPVLGMIDRFTEGMQAQGNGKLALKLEIPLRTHEKSKIAGTFQFTNNQIIVDPEVPPVEQASGRIEFTESAVHVPGVSATFLGGPVTVAAATQRDATVHLNLQGRANLDNLRRAAATPWWTQNLRGAADWKGAFILRKKVADLVVESSLQGIASSLPAPFGKTAGESVALRYERKFTGPQQEQISLSYGDVMNAQFIRRAEAGRSVVRRGTVQFGAPAPLPDRDGVWVSGTVKSLDLDRWLALTQQMPDAPPLDIGGVNLKIGELGLVDRRFHDVAVNATAQGGLWKATLSAREFEGSGTWRGTGQGRLTARMKKLAIPGAGAAPTPEDAIIRRRELPALDVVVEQFHFKDKALGRLELAAVPENRDWRIEKLRIVNPESTLAVEGVLQSVVAQPRTQVNLSLDVNDVSKLLARLGYPEGVRRGTAKLEGALNWVGGPQDFDYSLLSGNLVLDAAKGQFVKLEPGIGKLLGILSLQALPRRITLDFRDVFSDGFAFDQIVGAFRVNRGIATTENFLIRGPAARVFMNGEVNLVQETQKLDVKVIPSVSDSVSIAGALIGGPVAGVAAYVAQKILKDPLEQLVTYEYRVDGTWSDPRVSKIERQTPEADKPQ